MRVFSLFKRVMISLVLFVFLSFNVNAAEPFVCNDNFYQVFGSQGQLLTYDVNTDVFVVAPNSAGTSMNAFGFRVLDGFGYGVFFIPTPDIRLAQMMSDGTVTNRGTIVGLPGIQFPAGDFANDGLLYVYSGGDSIIFNRLYAVDVDAVEVVNTIDLAGLNFSTADIGFNVNDGLFYAVTNTELGSEIPPQNLITIDIVAQTVQVVGPTNLPVNSSIASMFVDGSGRVYGSNRITGILYQFDKDTGNATQVGDTVAIPLGVGGVDGFFCSANPGPPLEERSVPTLSEWGLMAMAVILGVVGYFVIQRRRFLIVK